MKPIIFLAILLLPLLSSAEEFSNTLELQINYAPPSWILNVSTQVLEEREPRLDPNESVLGDALRPLLDSGDYQAVALSMESAIADGSVLSPALLHILGQVYMALQDNSKAEQAFLNAVSVMPSFA